MKRRIQLGGWLLVMFVWLLLLGCQQQQPEVGPENGASDPPRPVPMRIVRDDLERRIAVPVNAKRVVSTAPSITEMIFAAGAGDRLVGVTTFCDFPEEAKSIAKIGDTMNPNLETIVALKPDIVFVSTASQLEAFMKTLEQNGIAVYVMDPTGLPHMYERSFSELGIIFDRYGIANELSSTLGARHREVCRITKGCLDRDKDGPAPDTVPVFVQISKEPLFTVGGDSFLRQLVRDAGGLLVTENIETPFPKLSKETAVVLDPEVIILSDSPDNQEPNDAFKSSPAVKNGRVYKINADILSRPGPRLVDALEQIARHLHPEKFRNK